VPDPVENLNSFVVNFPFAFAQILLSIALIEGASFPGDAWFGKLSREPGDLGYDPLGFFKNKTAAQKANLQLQELKVSRQLYLIFFIFLTNHCF